MIEGLILMSCCVGDLESYREAVERCDAQMKRVQERRAKVASPISL